MNEQSNKQVQVLLNDIQALLGRASELALHIKGIGETLDNPVTAEAEQIIVCYHTSGGPQNCILASSNGGAEKLKMVKEKIKAMLLKQSNTVNKKVIAKTQELSDIFGVTGDEGESNG